MAEYDVVLQLIAPSIVDRDDLERNMLDVLQVVETHGKDIALGPVVALDFAGRLIDLGFSVEADTPGRAQSMASDLLQIIETESDVQFSETATKSAAAATHAGICV
jgi:hypothetical protein